tara:strand:+ start:29672 stop:29956 length:285 start_codon:yes stop_codon:yes gene_type:complete
MEINLSDQFGLGGMCWAGHKLWSFVVLIVGIARHRILASDRRFYGFFVWSACLFYGAEVEARRRRIKLGLFCADHKVKRTNPLFILLGNGRLGA